MVLVDFFWLWFLLCSSIFILFLLLPFDFMFSWKALDKKFKSSTITVSYYLLFLLVPLFMFSLDSFFFLSIVLIIYVLVNQENMAVSLENILLKLQFPYRLQVLKRIDDEGSVITHLTLHSYVWSILVSEFYNFSDLFKSTRRDILVGVFNKQLPDVVSQRLKDAVKLQNKLLKYKKVEEPSIKKIETYEEFLILSNLWKKGRDPRVRFNFVSRLPWKFTFSLENNFIFKNLVSNGVIFYNFFKTTLLSLLLAFLYFFYTIFFFKIQFLKQLSVWFVIGMLYFWLMSGFNFFLKRYQFGKFTSQIQRFWKRTNMCFWLIEGFLILLFFYYFLNSSQEPMYMYDYSSLNQEYLLSLHSISLNIILLSLVIYFMYFTMLRINLNNWFQLNFYLIIISVFIFFSFFLETYQFYYVISTFNERLWVFNEDENLWSLDIENPILRVKQDYLLVCLIAKYWHFLFIFLSWVFFLIKSFEKKKVTIVLFGVNVQNMIILYALNFACYLQWFKWIYRRFFDLPYTWFMTNIDSKFFVKFFSEAKLIFISLLSNNLQVTQTIGYCYKSLNLWNVDSLALWKFI